jgi:nitric oxide synthase oxygenase domain/subunit
VKAAQIWFHSHALTALEVVRTAAVQLETYSRDQGWCDQPEYGSYSWFEIGISPGTGSGNADTIEADDGVVRWVRSHHNRLAKRNLAHLRGPIISIYDLELEVGGIVAVRACCQFGGWENKAENGRLRFWKWFEPVIPLA